MLANNVQCILRCYIFTHNEKNFDMFRYQFLVQLVKVEILLNSVW